MRNPDRQQMLILAASALLIGGFGVFKYIPVIRQKHALLERMDQQEQVIHQVCAQSALWPELKQKKLQVEKELTPFSQKIPQGRSFAQLWRQIADVMNDCNLKEQLVQPGTELKSDRLCSIPLTIECTGSLAQLFSFFQKLESFDRLIRIEEVRFENDTNFTGVLKMNAKANIYYQPGSTDKS